MINMQLIISFGRGVSGNVQLFLFGRQIGLITRNGSATEWRETIQGNYQSIRYNLRA